MVLFLATSWLRVKCSCYNAATYVTINGDFAQQLKIGRETAMKKSKKDRMRQRVRKLLRMATNDGASTQEAETAMRMARALADKHQLSLDSIHDYDMGQMVYQSYQELRPPPAWLSTLVYCLSDLNDCVMRLGKDPETKVFAFVISGLRSDCEFAGWMIDYVWLALNSASDRRSIEPLQFEPFARGFVTNIAKRCEVLKAERLREQDIREEERREAERREHGDVSVKSSKGGQDMLVIKQSLVKERFGESKIRREPAGNWQGDFDQVRSVHKGMLEAEEVALDRAPLESESDG